MLNVIYFQTSLLYTLLSSLATTRAATVVGIPKISRYTDFFQNSVFLEAKGGALLYVQKSVKLGIFATFFLKSR